MHIYEMISLTQRMLRISKEAWNEVRSLLVNEKLSNIQYNIVYVISNNPGISQDGVSKYLHLDKSSVAKLVAKLIDMNYITREKNPKDKREHCLYLTNKGEYEIEELKNLLLTWEAKYIGGSDSETYQELNKLVSEIESKVFKG